MQGVHMQGVDMQGVHMQGVHMQGVHMQRMELIWVVSLSPACTQADADAGVSAGAGASEGVGAGAVANAVASVAGGDMAVQARSDLGFVTVAKQSANATAPSSPIRLPPSSSVRSAGSTLGWASPPARATSPRSPIWLWVNCRETKLGSGSANKADCVTGKGRCKPPLTRP